MVEGTAFKGNSDTFQVIERLSCLTFCHFFAQAFEMWWDEQQKRDTKTAAGANSSSLALPSSQQKIQISQPLPSISAEKKIGLGFENLGFGLGLGLGIRAAMPKMPSFRVNNYFRLKYGNSSFLIFF